MDLFPYSYILHIPRLKMPFYNQTNKCIAGDVHNDKK